MENLVRIDLLWRRWIDILSGLVVALLETWRTKRALIVTAGKDGFAVCRDGAAERADVATLAKGARAPDDLIRDARRRFITLELPAEEIAVARISVPARAAEFLAGIVSNQIERLSPWQGNEVAYGFSAGPNDKDPATLDVRVLMASRTVVDAARDELATAGLAADRIVARAQGADAGVAVPVWSRRDSVTDGGRDRVRRALTVALIVALLITAGVATWAQISAASIRSDSEEAAARTAVLQRELQAGRAGSLSALRDPAERAWAAKESLPSAVMVLEALSQTLPDDAYVTELSLQGAAVRIVGLTSDAPALIAPLEKSGQFADVHFFAPTTRSPDGAAFLFHIEGRATPRPVVAEK
jgi:general secretion pathway protein L